MLCARSKQKKQTANGKALDDQIGLDAVKRTKKSGVRGPHAQRTAAMRRKLIDAAIECLHEHGYGKTTLQRVTDIADVSRGAFLHHFPTRADLLVAVAEFAAEKQNKHVSRLLADTKPGRERFDAITMATWDALQQPAAIALLEIKIGARSDQEIGEPFADVIRSLTDFQTNGVWNVAQEAGITDHDRVIDMVLLHMAAMQGLVLEYLYSGDKAPAEKCMTLLKHYKDTLTGELLKAAEAN